MSDAVVDREDATAESDGDAADAPGVTPLRVLSLWFAFTLSVGLLAGLVIQSIPVVDATLGSQDRTLVTSGLSLVAAVAVLRRWPDFETHVAWRVDYGVVLGFWLAIAAGIAEMAAGATSWSVGPWPWLPLGLAVGVAVEYHRNHRDA